MVGEKFLERRALGLLRVADHGFIIFERRRWIIPLAGPRIKGRKPQLTIVAICLVASACPLLAGSSLNLRLLGDL
jgi:hypothetical protein